MRKVSEESAEFDFDCMKRIREKRLEKVDPDEYDEMMMEAISTIQHPPYFKRVLRFYQKHSFKK